MIRPLSDMDRPVAARSSQRSKLTYVALAAGALLIGGFFLPSLIRFWRADATVDRAAIRTARVTRGDLVRDFGAQGRVVAASHPTLYSPAPGLVERLVRPGQAVDRDQPLARVDSPELTSRGKQETSRLASLVADLEQARLAARQTGIASAQAVDLARVRFETAERGMSRAERSRAEGILNDVQYEAAQDAQRIARLELGAAEQTAILDQETAAAAVRRQQAEVDRQRLVVDELTRQVAGLLVRSPVAGQVGDFLVDERDVVVAGQPVVAVVDLSAFEVEIQVPESAARELAAGSPAEVVHDGKRFAAAVHTISAEVTAGQVRCTLAFTADAPAELRQGQRVSARLVFELRPDVLLVERGPFLEAGGGRRAWVVDGDVATPRIIEIGATSINAVEIVSGLREGEEIVTSDPARFANATRVHIRGR